MIRFYFRKESGEYFAATEWITNIYATYSGKNVDYFLFLFLKLDKCA